tara:strand:+ start:1774 stop:2214 length:441 start_codon:yes stop_codon:yes gene_type:complete
MDRIRKIDFNDLPSLETLEKLIFKDNWSKKIIENQIKNCDSINLLVTKNKKIIAYMFSHKYEDFIEIERIGVVMEERRNNLAEKLLKKTENIANECGIKKLLLEVRESNISAINLYKKLNYKKDSIRKGYYKIDKENALLMSKKLD